MILSGIRSGLLSSPTVGLDAINLPRLLPVPVALEHASSATDGTVFTTGSKTPLPGYLQLLVVVSAHTTTGEAPSSVTGCGLTWVKIADLATGTAATRRVSLWRARSTTPTTGALTITHATSHLSCGWGWVQVPDVVEDGLNGAGAIQQSKTANTSGGAATTLNLALTSALEHPNNIHISTIGLVAQATVTPDTDFTELGDDNETAATLTVETAWARNQQGNDPTWASTNAAGIDVEVRAG